MFKLKSTSRLPAQSVLFSVTSNKIQIINMIIADFLDHKHDNVSHSLIVTGPDPVPFELSGAGLTIYRQDLRTTQEEADTIIIQQVSFYNCFN